MKVGGREEAQGGGPGRKLLKGLSCYLEVAVEQWTPLVCDFPNSTSAQEDLAYSDTSGSSHQW